MKIFVVSDIHSFYSNLIKSLNEKGFNRNNKDHYLLCCGDLFDRGDETVKLYKFVSDLKDRFIYIRGNHEDLLVDLYHNLLKGGDIDYYNVANGTVKTLISFLGGSKNAREVIMKIYSGLKLGIKDCKYLKKTLSPIIKFIEEKSINYYEINNNIFVHGWIPLNEGMNNIDEDWKSSLRWKDARWINGMWAWSNGYTLEDKTIYCGHWHCSWGWSKIDKDREEFPNTNSVAILRHSFEPYKKQGIVALDGCTSYTGIVNVEVINCG